MDKLHRFLDLHHFRIKGSSQRTIKAYREALAFFLDKQPPFYHTVSERNQVPIPESLRE